MFRPPLRNMFWYFHLLTLCVLSTPLAWSQIMGVVPGDPRSPDQPESKYSLSGTVLNSVTGEPVNRALIQIYGQTQRMVFSDSQGHFTIAHLPPFQTTLNVIKPGFIRENPKPWNQRKRMVTVGPDAVPVTIKLTPEAEIFGTITGSSGEPLERVPVKLLSFTVENGIRKRQEFRQVQTGDDGEFEFPDLPPGDYLLSAGPSWSGLFDPFGADSIDHLANSQKFYPGVQDIAEAGLIHLAAAKRQRADLSLETVQTFSISGSVVGGIPGRGSLEVLNAAGQSVSMAQQRDGPDSFRVRVPAGHCIIKAHSYDDQGNSFYGQAGIDVSADLQGVRVNVERISIPITVQRLDVKERSPENSSFTRIGGFAEGPVSLRLISLDPLHHDASSTVRGGPEHWVSEIAGIEYGRYRVEMNESGFWYPQSITYGASDLRSEPLVVAPGSMQPIEITLRNDSAMLAVTVVSSSDQQDFEAVVIAISEENLSKPILSYLNYHNQSQQVSLPPGKYSFYAFEDPGDLEYANPEAMQKYSARAAAVRLLPNQNAKVSLNLIRSAE